MTGNVMPPHHRPAPEKEKGSHFPKNPRLTWTFQAQLRDLDIPDHTIEPKLGTSKDEGNEGYGGQRKRLQLDTHQINIKTMMSNEIKKMKDEMRICRTQL